MYCKYVSVLRPPPRNNVFDVDFKQPGPYFVTFQFILHSCHAWPIPGKTVMRRFPILEVVQRFEQLFFNDIAGLASLSRPTALVGVRLPCLGQEAMQAYGEGLTNAYCTLCRTDL